MYRGFTMQEEKSGLGAVSGSFWSRIKRSEIYLSALLPYLASLSHVITTVVIFLTVSAVLLEDRVLSV
jgi:hypothetical protein